MLILYSIISIFGAFIWVQYYRQIDIFDREINYTLIVSFLLGCASVVPVLLLSRWKDVLFFVNDGTPLGDFLYATVEVGFVEESSKVLAFLLSMVLVRKHLNEPLDYIIHISVVALGFSTVENILYFRNYGPDIINSRIVFSSFGHVFDTSVFAYGLIHAQRKGKQIYRFLLPVLYLVLAALAHGVYDFLLIHEFDLNTIFFVLYFFMMVSIYSTIVNNALNVSPHFTYTKVVNPRRVLSTLLMYYGIFLLAQLAILIIDKGVLEGLKHMFAGVIQMGLIMLVILVRLSRFTLIRDDWKRIRPELPFSYGSIGQDGSTKMNWAIKGDGVDEADVGELFGRDLFLCPLSLRSSALLEGDVKVKMSEKLFLEEDEIYYGISIEERTHYLQQPLYIKAKTFETTKAREQYPIVALMEIREEGDEMTPQNLSFIQWAYLKENFGEGE